MSLRTSEVAQNLSNCNYILERSRGLPENLRDSESSGRQESGTAVDGWQDERLRTGTRNDILGRDPVGPLAPLGGLAEALLQYNRSF
jgi:hypothetical protein